MKIDKRNIMHWIYLVLFVLNVVFALVLRAFRRRRASKRVVLYGHKLAGNLLALYDHLRRPDQPDIKVVFLTLDPAYCRELRQRGVSAVLAIAPHHCVRQIIQADAIISDHGLHALRLLLRLSSVKFFDVWHGIPFKGFDADDFRDQHRYDEAWVASPLLAKLYVERFGFEADRVRTTGYARTDRLVRLDEDTESLKHRFGVNGQDHRRIALFAPTWRQDSRSRSIFPFGADETSFCRALSDVGRRTGSTILIRAHLNTTAARQRRELEHIMHLPYSEFPDTEGILLISDLLVCDWSSIAFDYLLLQRPTIFLDVEPPFAKGFSLGPEYRFGAIAANMGVFLDTLEQYLSEPSLYHKRYDAKARRVREEVYSTYADGRATERCVERLRRHLHSTSR